MDNTFKTPEDVREHIPLPFLGMVPDVGLKLPGGVSRGPQLVKSPNSAVADAYRVLRTNLIFSSAETTGRVMLVTSANPAEGKTTTLANLAVALAQNGAKVLAVDADLRRPTLYQHFAVPKTPGLTDLIVGKAAASQAIHSTKIDGLQLLPCGYQPPNPAELLGSPMMKQIIEALRAHYEWVLIDAPPLLAMADAPVLCPLVDGVVMVIAAESATKPAVMRAIDQVNSVGGKVAGLVLNKVNLERNSYYYSQYYGEYYRSYYAESNKQAARRAEAQAPGLEIAGAAGAAGVKEQASMRFEATNPRTLRSGRMHPLRRAAHVFLVVLLVLPAGDVMSAPAAGTIQGVVRLEGRPMSGVTVAFIELQSGSVVRAISSADGGFKTAAPTGEYAVTTESQAGLAVGQAPVKVAVADGRVASANVELVAVASRDRAGPGRGAAAAAAAGPARRRAGPGARDVRPDHRQRRPDPVPAGDLLHRRRVPAARLRDRADGLGRARTRLLQGRGRRRVLLRRDDAGPGPLLRQAAAAARRGFADHLLPAVHDDRVRGEPDAGDRGDRRAGQGRVRRPRGGRDRSARRRDRLLRGDRSVGPGAGGLRGRCGFGPRGGLDHGDRRGRRCGGRRGRRGGVAGRRRWCDAAADHRHSLADPATGAAAAADTDPDHHVPLIRSAERSALADRAALDAAVQFGVDSEPLPDWERLLAAPAHSGR